MVLLDEPRVPTWEEINDMITHYGESPQAQEYYEAVDDRYDYTPVAVPEYTGPGSMAELQQIWTKRKRAEDLARRHVPPSVAQRRPGKAVEGCPTCPSRLFKKERRSARRSTKKSGPSWLEMCGYRPGSGEITQHTLNEMVARDPERAYSTLHFMGMMRNGRRAGSGTKLLAQARAVKKVICREVNMRSR